MDRRQFLQAALLPLVIPQGTPPDLGRVTITRVTGFTHVATRPRAVGPDARNDARGQTIAEGVLRIETDLGFEGVGFGDSRPELAKGLVGRAVQDFWKPRIGFVSPLGRSDQALYDLVGKALNLPAWKLLGGAGPEWVPVCDASLGFNDLLPEARDRGIARLLDDVEASLKAGHRAFLIKVGRGFRGMDPEAGFARDVEVIRAIRKLAGKDARLMADGDGAFDLDAARRFLDAVGGELFLVAGMGPETVEGQIALKEYLRARGLPTLLAGGASAGDIDDFDAPIARDALDVLRPDIRAFGLSRQVALSRKISVRPKVKLEPRNGGSFLASAMQLALARGVSNVLMVEQDPCSSDLFDASACEIKDGKVRVPDAPGLGISLREDIFNERYRKDAWTVVG
jgi:L-alanine-DL-glutamate epimerase-like enolase superfamily enzyme